ncbi:MAG: hypothetical protein CMN76_13160 [Spirochaetaceae bacterium]|nr:hypothetical protein [Spirochaetaceae bacterium]|tara:strand:- start:42872 stop:43951 length:1080 start_codon:yes stop_codon:yes gene_type:complete
MLWRKQSSIYALTRLAFLFGASFFAVIPVSAQILNPNVIGTEQENEKNRPRDIDDFRLAINPGVVVLAEDLTIKRNETDTVESIAVLDGGARASWHVDLTTADWKLGEHVGLHLQAWAGNMHYKKQVINTLNERGEDDRVSSDLGTRMTGYYTVVSPVFYLGSRSRYKGFRIGLGYGVQSLRLSGNFLFRDEDERVLLFSETAASRFDFIDNLRQTTLLSSGFNITGGDPLASYMILTLNQPLGLENYGRYILLRDGFSLRGNNLFLLQYLLRGPPSGKLNLSLEEAYGAISLGRNNLNVSRRAAGTGFVFISWGTDFLCPTEACIYQATYGATMFRERELQLDLRLFRFSYSIRLVLL